MHDFRPALPTRPNRVGTAECMLCLTQGAFGAGPAYESRNRYDRRPYCRAAGGVGGLGPR